MRLETSTKTISDLREYLRDHNIQGPLFNRDDVKKICVSILSVARPGQRYLTQTVAALLSRMPLHLQSQIQITIHNMNIPPEENSEALGLKDLIHVRNAIYRPERHPKSYANKYLNFVKESIDYTVVLDHVYGSGCEYGLLLEDDALAAGDWAIKLLQTIDQMPTSTPPWMVMKLFSTFKWIPFYWGSPSDVALIAALSVILSFLIASTVFIVAKAFGASKRDQPRYELLSSKRQIDQNLIGVPNIWTIILLLVSSGLFVVFLGKHNILLYGPGVHNISIGASCVANLYPRAELKKFRDYLYDSFSKYEAEDNLWELPNKDLHFREVIAQEEVKNGWRYQELIRLPNLFQHIGAKTSLDKSSSFETTAISRHYLDNEMPIIFDPKKFNKK
jgi:hypothetical protein